MSHFTCLVIGDNPEEQLAPCMTKDQKTALRCIESMPDGPIKTAMTFFVVNVCQVGCGENDGCFYCDAHHRALKVFGEHFSCPVEAEANTILFWDKIQRGKKEPE